MKPDLHTWVEGFIMTRAEGRTDDPVWPCGEAVVRERTNPFDNPFDYRLSLAASVLDHDGYDKFDLTVIYSDGRQERLRFDLDRNFTSLREHFPTLFQPRTSDEA